MNTDTIAFLFCSLVFALLAIMILCIWKICGIYSSKKVPYIPIALRSKEQREKGSLMSPEDLKHWGDRIRKACDISDVPPLDIVIKQQQKEKDQKKPICSDATPSIKQDTDTSHKITPQIDGVILDDVTKALVSLGYKSKKAIQAAQEAINQCPQYSTPELISYALRLL